MANLAKKLADRFKPGIFDRLKQSQDSKQQAKERRLHIVPPPKPERKKKEKKVAVDVSTRPSTGAILQSSSVFAESNGVLRRNDVWREWNTYATATSCYDTQTTWDIWHGGTGGSITCNGLGSAQTVWQGWTSGNVNIRTNIITSSIGETWDNWNARAPHREPRLDPRPVETPQQRIVREQQEAQYRAERAAENARYEEEQLVRRRRTAAAEARAMDLLVSMLNPQQQSDLKNYKYFFVEAPSGRLYRIDYGMHGNVKVVDRVTRKIIERLCIQPSGVMAGDANLMQKLLIETAEDAFRAHANITLENGAVIHGRYEGLSDERIDNVIPLIRKAA
jgi:hypothetical protein